MTDDPGQVDFREGRKPTLRVSKQMRVILLALRPKQYLTAVSDVKLDTSSYISSEIPVFSRNHSQYLPCYPQTNLLRPVSDFFVGSRQSSQLQAGCIGELSICSIRISGIPTQTKLARFALSR